MGLLDDHLGRRLRRTSAISRCYPILPKYFGAPRRPPRRRLRRTAAISRCYPILPNYFGAPRRPPRPSATAYRGHFTLLPHFAKIFWGSSPTTPAVGYGVPRPFHAARPFLPDFQGVLARRLRRTSANSRCSPIFSIFLGSSRTPTPLYRAGFLWGAPLFGHRCKTVLCPVVKPSREPELDPWAVPATLRTACSPAVPPTPTRTRSLGPAGTTYPLYRHLARRLRRTSAISRCYPILPKKIWSSPTPTPLYRAGFLWGAPLLGRLYKTVLCPVQKTSTEPELDPWAVSATLRTAGPLGRPAYPDPSSVFLPIVRTFFSTLNSREDSLRPLSWGRISWGGSTFLPPIQNSAFPLPKNSTEFFGPDGTTYPPI